jgi:branched-chain amino acid transport system substrate-binding protein
VNSRRKTLGSLLLAMALATLSATAAAAGNIKIAIDAEFGIPNSTSAQAVRHGAQVAVNEINAAGGVLGRKLEIIERDNRAVPARSRNNLRELAADPDVVAVMCARYSPVVVELLPEIHRLKMLMLDPWAAADAITDNGFSPNYVFRLSLRDSWALQVMMRHALKQGHRKVGILLPNTEWGRSSLKAA